MENVRELRLPVDLGNDVRAICKLSFSKRDVSLYLFPYAPSGRYYYGGSTIEGVEFQYTIQLTDQKYSEDLPKLSIHESGQVYIKSKNLLVGPFLVPAFYEWKGQHLASVSIDDFAILRPYQEELSVSGIRLDHVIPSSELVKSGRLVFYLTGDKPSFTEPNCRLIVRMMRPTLFSPIFIAIQPKSQAPMGKKGEKGITVLTGWNPFISESHVTNYLFIRGM